MLKQSHIHDSISRVQVGRGVDALKKAFLQRFQQRDGRTDLQSRVYATKDKPDRPIKILSQIARASVCGCFKTIQNPFLSSFAQMGQFGQWMTDVTAKKKYIE